jgi:hypothetical protein
MRSRLPFIVLTVGIAAVTATLAVATAAGPNQTSSTTTSARMPQYDKDRALLLPDDYREWILAGTSLGLSYAEGAQAPQDPMFHETLIEPTAYRDFARTGQFREGTMLALILHGTGQNVLPGRHGQFASDVHGVEMAVKDSSRVPEGWAYYGFGGMNRAPNRTAQPQPKANCYACHSEHAKRDNVFLQFYALLSAAAPDAR